MNGIGVVLLVLACFAQNIASKDCGKAAQSKWDGWDNYNWPASQRAWDLGRMDWECAPQFFCSRMQEYCWLSFSNGRGVELHAHVPFVTENNHLLFNNLVESSRGKKVINLAEKTDRENMNLFALKEVCKDRMDRRLVPSGHTVRLGDLARQWNGQGRDEDYYGELLRKLDNALQRAYNANPYQLGGK